RQQRPRTRRRRPGGEQSARRQCPARSADRRGTFAAAVRRPRPAGTDQRPARAPHVSRHCAVSSRRPARRRRGRERGRPGRDDARRAGWKRCRGGPHRAARQRRVRAAAAGPDRLVQAYNRAAADPFNDARLSAVTALGAIARASTEGRLAVAGRFLAAVPRADDYLVRRLAAERLPDAAERWGAAAPITTGRGAEAYRDAVRRYLLAALRGQPPRVTIETDRGTMAVELYATEAPLTVAAFLSLVDRRY